jgi:hypothetical protein
MFARTAGPEGPQRLPSLRPAPTGRRALIARLGALLLLSLAVATAGCGGDEESAAKPAPEAPELTIPETDAQPAPPTETTPTTETTPPSTSGGTTTPEQQPQAPADTPENDTPPPANSPAERFEDFCNDNPGACG